MYDRYYFAVEFLEIVSAEKGNIRDETLQGPSPLVIVVEPQAAEIGCPTQPGQAPRHTKNTVVCTIRRTHIQSDQSLRHALLTMN